MKEEHRQRPDGTGAGGAANGGHGRRRPAGEDPWGRSLASRSRLARSRTVVVFGTMDVATRIPDEREAPLHFAGRKDELRAYDSKLAALCKTGRSGGLFLTIGVPGSGKTQLGQKFADSVVASPNVEGRTVSALLISPEELSDTTTLFKLMGRAVNAEQQAIEIAQLDDRVSNVGGNVLGSGGAIARDVGRHTAAFPGLLRESVEKGMWDNRALVLIIDELQSIEDDAFAPLRVLHQGLTGCPVFLMGLGLQHTADELANPSHGRGISRIVAPMVLGPLDHDTTVCAFARNLAATGFDDLPDKSLQALAKASHGFPQHINGYLEGAHAALTHHKHLAGQSLDEALRHGHARRVQYYQARLSAGKSHDPMLAVVAAMERANATALKQREAEKVVAQAGFEVDAVDKAVAHGSLALAGGNVSFGIPSFHGYMRNLLEQDRTRS